MGPGEGLFSFLAIIFFIVIFVFLMRLIGAWMLRINEVIDQLKSINMKLKRIDDRVEKG